MKINPFHHLTYCTNIHPAQRWEAVFASLQEYVLPLKQHLAPAAPFGIGLRLSDQASRELVEGHNLANFKHWLDAEGLYVAIINGFPYGSFHGQAVKDHVYAPDWTTTERLNYTLRLCQILTELLPEGVDGGISTCPISYKPWFKGDPEKTTSAFETATHHLMRVVEEMRKIELETGKWLHLDIEPEPDCLLETSQEMADYFTTWALPIGAVQLQDTYGIARKEAEKAIGRHLQVCYDVCHFAVEHEKPAEALARMQKAGLGIGRIQISAALKAHLGAAVADRQAAGDRLRAFAESTYLHQVILQTEAGELLRYPDLPEALAALDEVEAGELRTHFHVPVFLKEYDGLASTQDDILEVLAMLEQQPLTTHLEVETYTWEVLPSDLKLELGASIKRELEWVMGRLQGFGQQN